MELYLSSPFLPMFILAVSTALIGLAFLLHIRQEPQDAHGKNRK